MYPYGYIVGPILIEFLVIGIALFKKFPRARKYVLLSLFLGGVFEVFNGTYTDGISIGFLTLTCAGALTVFRFVKSFSNRVLASLLFFAFGCFLMFQALTFFFHAAVNFQYMWNLTSWSILTSWALAALGSSALLLITAFRNRSSTN